MLELDSSFYLSVNYFKTETHASVEGKNWFKAQSTEVNKFKTISWKTWHRRREFQAKQTTVVEKL